MATKQTKAVKNRYHGTGLSGQEQSALWWAATYGTMKRLVKEIEGVTDPGLDEGELAVAADMLRDVMEHFAAACPDTVVRVPVPA